MSIHLTYSFLLALLTLVAALAHAGDEASFYAFEWTVKNVSCQDIYAHAHVFLNLGGNPVNEWDGWISVPSHSSVMFQFAKVIMGNMPLGHFEFVDGETGGDGVLNIQVGQSCGGDTNGTNHLYAAVEVNQIRGIYARRKDGSSALVRIYRRQGLEYKKIY